MSKPSYKNTTSNYIIKVKLEMNFYFSTIPTNLESLAIFISPSLDTERINVYYHSTKIA